MHAPRAAGRWRDLARHKRPLAFDDHSYAAKPATAHEAVRRPGAQGQNAQAGDPCGEARALPARQSHLPAVVGTIFTVLRSRPRAEGEHHAPTVHGGCAGPSRGPSFSARPHARKTEAGRMSLDLFPVGTWSATSTTNWSSRAYGNLKMLGRREAGSAHGHRQRVIRLDLFQEKLVSDDADWPEIRVAAAIAVDLFRSGGASLVHDASEHPARTDTFESMNRSVT